MPLAGHHSRARDRSPRPTHPRPRASVSARDNPLRGGHGRHGVAPLPVPVQTGRLGHGVSVRVLHRTGAGVRVRPEHPRLAEAGDERDGGDVRDYRRREHRAVPCFVRLGRHGPGLLPAAVYRDQPRDPPGAAAGDEAVARRGQHPEIVSHRRRLGGNADPNLRGAAVAHVLLESGRVALRRGIW